MHLIHFMKVLIIATVVQVAWITDASAFSCYDTTGNTVGNNSASVNVIVNLEPVLGVGQNLVVDLSQSIFCKNTNPMNRNDNVNMLSGSAYAGVLQGFKGRLMYYGNSYPFPLTSATGTHNFTVVPYTAWETSISLSPTTAAGGIFLKGGTKFASLVMKMVGSNKTDGGNVNGLTVTWNLYASNDVIIPTGTCDVSSRDLTIQLPEYPGSKPIPLSVHCVSGQNIAFKLSGNTVTSNNIFSNTYPETNSASGVGIQLLRNGSPIPAGQNISLGTVGTSPVDLNLTATYARTSGQVTAGGVQSIIGVEFVYD